MPIWAWALAAVAVGLLAYLMFYATSAKEDGYTVLKGSEKGGKMWTSQVVLPRSFNEKEGAVYSWTSWLYVKNFSAGFGARRRIFSKDDAPGLYIDSTSNSFGVVVKTYGSTPETILVSNIPAMKWIHVAIVVDQTSVSIYINGTLRIYHTMTQLPKQNSDVATFGGQWEGVIGNVRYYSRALSNAEVFMKSSETPPDDFQKKPESGRYFDLSWYTGRL